MSQAERSATRPCDEIENPDADILTAMVTLAGDAFVAAFSHSLEGSINLRDVAGDVPETVSMAVTAENDSSVA